MAVVYAVYILMIPFGGKFASNFGYRHSIALSVPFQIFYWLALLASIGHPMAAFLAAPILALQKSFYCPVSIVLWLITGKPNKSAGSLEQCMLWKIFRLLAGR